MSEIETDYLVIGAGASGMAFADALIASSDADSVLVDRRHCPGGHWNDAYPFVRIHHASACYGVNSLDLGTDSIDQFGTNAGFYERASGVEICAYFQRVLDDILLPSGRVRFFGLCDYVGDWESEHIFVSRLTGEQTNVRVRQKIVDTTYLEVAVPATHQPAFAVDADAKLIPVGELVKQAARPSGYTILGGGKTAMDACMWLMEQGEDPDRICWVRPRESWLLDRKTLQPLDLVTETVDGFSLCTEALAQAESTDDLWRRLQNCGQLFRLDERITPTMYRGAILSADERESLAQIENIIRLGHVKHLGSRRIVLDDGEIVVDPTCIHVDCTAYGFRTATARPIFSPTRITVQSLIGGHTTYNSALIGFIESTARDEREKNRLCPPLAQVNLPRHWIEVMDAVLRTSLLHSAESDISDWQKRSRLSLTRGVDAHLDDPRMKTARKRWYKHSEQALVNAKRLLASGR